MVDERTPRRYRAKGSVRDPPAVFTTIEWDWSDHTIGWRNGLSLAIPTVDEDDRRALVATVRADARHINNGWTDTMPALNTDLDVFVDADDPRNGNPPIEVNRKT